MKMKLDTIAKKILQSNIYMTLATVDKNGVPWASPVYYCMDENCNFYFISSPKSRHIRNLKHTNRASFAIFDSHQPEGTGNGIQGSGVVHELANGDLLEGLKHYHTSFFKVVTAMFQGKAFYRMYKLEPRELFVLDPEKNVDARVSVLISRHNPDPRCI